MQPRSNGETEWPFKVEGLLLAGGLLIVPGMLGILNYLLFHSLVELFSVGVVMTAFLIGWNVRRRMDNGFLLFVAIAYAAVSVLDLAHLLAYKGLGIFPDATANLPTQLWIAARYLQALSLLAAPLFVARWLPAKTVLTVFLLIDVVLLAAIFRPFPFIPPLPDCYREGFVPPLTQFKIVSEYIVCGMFLAALGLLWMIRSWLDRAVLIYMAGSIGATVVSELFFAAYSSVTGPANLAGHLLRAVAFYLVYKALIEAGLDRPFEVLFRLARSNQDLEQFAHMASHDLKAPLRMISGFMDLLQERVAEKLDAKALGYIEYAAGSVLRMQQLLDDLLENALKFGGDRKPEVHLGARRVDGEWEFSVRDHGIGIDLAYRDQICIIFQRLHAADRHPGSGVGLAICKKIVERQGGRIWVESAPGEGATFRFTFPAGA